MSMTPHQPRRLALGLALMAATTLPAWAAGPVLKPGLWEHEVQVRSRSGQAEAAMAQMRKQLEGMPPAQRQQFEAMLAQQGMQLGGSSGKANVQSFRVCLTREQAEQGEIAPPEEGCTQEVLERSAKRMKLRFNCVATGDRPASKGEGEITVVSDSAYTGKSVLETAVNGKPEQLQLDQSARWVAGDCGQVKPRGNAALPNSNR